MSIHNMFLCRIEENINIILVEKVPYLELCHSLRLALVTAYFIRVCVLGNVVPLLFLKVNRNQRPYFSWSAR